MVAYWEVHFEKGLGHMEAALFAYLARQCNALWGKNPFQAQTSRLELDLQMHAQEVSRARKKLVRADVITYSAGRRGVAPTYGILVGCELSVSQAVSNQPKKRTKRGQEVPESVILHKIDKKIEGEMAEPSHSQDLISRLEEKYPNRADIDHVLAKMRVHYSAKPAMIVFERACDWMDREDKPKFKPPELPIEELPVEPAGFRKWFKTEYPNAEHLHAVEWSELWQRQREVCQEALSVSQPVTNV